jgi:polyphosphate kinase
VPPVASVPLLNRELSRLDYNRRVLAKADDPSVPLLERLRFLAWCSRNLDEFFMVRVGSTRDLIDAGVTEASADGMTPSLQLAEMRGRARELLDEMHRLLDSRLLPQLRDRGVTIPDFASLETSEKEVLSRYFESQVAPVLTPLAIDPGHPFPFVANLSLNLAVTVESERAGQSVVLIKVPPLIPRFVALPDGKRFVPIGSLLVAHLDHFFPHATVRSAVLFRVIRNSELTFDDDEIEDLRVTVETELRRRERRQVVCLEVDERADDALRQLLIAGTRARAEDIYPVAGLLKPSDLREICDRVADPALRYPEFNPRLPHRLASSADMFSIIRSGDVLLHRPYESFSAVIELLAAAAADPDVVAIKQTLYQTDENSPVVDKLALAAMNGKQVTVVIELQARFEEKRNIALAARLTDAGAQVVYGLLGLQTHAKLTVVLRTEGEGLRHYVHASTGNYSTEAARAYTDLDLLTANDAFGREASRLINVLTGYSAASLESVINGEDRPRWELFVVSPFDYHRWLIARIQREAAHAAAGKPAQIIAKLNSLVDPSVIHALYDASSKGVQIDLVVRSICCLVPGVRGMSDNIRVTSIVDRFLEHERIVRFQNAGRPEVFLSSGDWMQRNFLRRVEVTFPLLDAGTRAAAEAILEISLRDTASSWQLQSDGTWQRREAKTPFSSQERFIEQARVEAVRLGNYEETIRHSTRVRRKAKSKSKHRSKG